MIMRGEAAAALAELRDQYRSGADPEVTLNDLAETAHWLSTLKIAPDIADDPSLPAETRARGRELAETLPMRVLARSWQMLLKALEETRSAPSPLMAAEMSVIRLCAVADLPTPGDLIRKLENAPADAAPAPRPNGGGGGGGGGGGASALRVAASAPAPQPRVEAPPAPRVETAALPQDFTAVVTLIREKRDGILLHDVETGLRLISYAPGRIEFCPAAGAPEHLAGTLSERLRHWTGARWTISIGDEPGEPTIAETRAADNHNLDQRVRRHPLVAAALAAFPEGELLSIPLNTAGSVPDMPVEPEDDDDEDMDLLGEN